MIEVLLENAGMKIEKNRLRIRVPDIPMKNGLKKGASILFTSLKKYAPPKSVAGVLGIEPSSAVLETVILPMYDTPINYFYTITRFLKIFNAFFAF